MIPWDGNVLQHVPGSPAWRGEGERAALLGAVGKGTVGWCPSLSHAGGVLQAD